MHGSLRLSGSSRVFVPICQFELRDADTPSHDGRHTAVESHHGAERQPLTGATHNLAKPDPLVTGSPGEKSWPERLSKFVGLGVRESEGLEQPAAGLHINSP